MKTVHPELSVHSIRRGAATTLADQGWPMEQIQLITGHTPTEDRRLAVRRYVDASPHQPESRLIQEMAWGLMSPIWKRLMSLTAVC